MEPAQFEQLLAQHPRVSLAQLPTPLTPLSRLSRLYGCRLFCKRDDLTGFAFGGNKARKLEFLMAHAQRAGADTLIAVGAVQSNFCRMAAAAAARAEMDCYLVLGGTPPARPSGNLILDEILGAQLKFCDSEDWDDWEQAAVDLAEVLRARGRHVYVMPLGGSSAVGVLGYVAGFGELMRDFKRLRDTCDHIVLASSTGGTQAGLVVGRALAGWSGRVTGISVASDQLGLANDVFMLAQKAARLTGTRVSARDVRVDDGYVGEGYGVPTAETLDAIEVFARLEGIFLDRVYTGKAAAALLDYLEQERIAADETVVFWHTGGGVELFANPVPGTT
ncbi:MAG: D-cysteine desulfhydrase family protein [Pseudomonadota bacterium]